MVFFSDIPGFYYDSSRKKYFKIQENQNSSCTGFVTSTTIRKKLTEKIRSSDVAALHAVKHNQQVKKNKNPKFVDLWRRADGTISGLQYKYETLRRLYANLRPILCATINDDSDQQVGKLGRMRQMLAFRSDSNEVVCLWSVQGKLASKIQTLRLSEFDCPAQGVRFSVKSTGNTIRQEYRRVTSMQTGRGQSGEDFIVCTTIASIGVPTAIVKLCDMKDSNPLVADYNIGKTLISCMNKRL